MARARDLAYGQRAIRRLLRELDHPQELEHKYAAALLQQAVRNAAARPTPQAPMAAANMQVDGANIVPRSAGGDPAEVAIGSEFGSHIYKQFQHGPAPRGLWLYPAAEDTQVLATANRELERLLDQVIAHG